MCICVCLCARLTHRSALFSFGFRRHCVFALHYTSITKCFSCSAILPCRRKLFFNLHVICVWRSFSISLRDFSSRKYLEEVADGILVFTSSDICFWKVTLRAEFHWNIWKCAKGHLNSDLGVKKEIFHVSINFVLFSLPNCGIIDVPWKHTDKNSVSKNSF